MWRMVLAGVVMAAVTLFGFSLVNVSGGAGITTNTVVLPSAGSTDGFARATEPLDWEFPRNFGPHPEYQTEWWYYTGNLTADTGEEFGFQFTIFRRALAPVTPDSDSEWRDNQIYLAHFSLAHLAEERFFHEDRYSRSGNGLAGATVDPAYRVWVEDWQVVALNDEATLTRITAHAAEFGVDLTLEQVKPPALQGYGGLSPKSGDIGNASHYYTLSRLITAGTVTVEGRQFTVSGLSWKDHEFSTSALADNAQGWDWFALIFDDYTEMMVGQIRLKDGGREPAFGGLFIHEDGSTTYLPSSSFTITPTDWWTSPHTGAVYPSGWIVNVNHQDIQYELTLTPAMRDQELHTTTIDYWEGAIRISGDKNGVGYAELTGYVDAMAGRF